MCLHGKSDVTGHSNWMKPSFSSMFEVPSIACLKVSLSWFSLPYQRITAWRSALFFQSSCIITTQKDNASMTTLVFLLNLRKDFTTTSATLHIFSSTLGYSCIYWSNANKYLRNLRLSQAPEDSGAPTSMASEGSCHSGRRCSWLCDQVLRWLREETQEQRYCETMWY